MTARAPPSMAVFPGRTLNLVLATVASIVGFWAWTVIAPIGALYTQQLDLDSSQTSILVAMPILVGALGRIIVGSLTDRYGGRIMFTLILLGAVPPLLLVTLGAHRN